mmetsp:Transcript_4055/g.8473  ORF Transcript_4055/g.8473 Transcript_4055/m.8473 type:complete len:217 (-) Transcript_4055:1320-1970(-)
MDEHPERVLLWHIHEEHGRQKAHPLAVPHPPIVQAVGPQHPPQPGLSVVPLLQPRLLPGVHGGQSHRCLLRLLVVRRHGEHDVPWKRPVDVPFDGVRGLLRRGEAAAQVLEVGHASRAPCLPLGAVDFGEFRPEFAPVFVGDAPPCAPLDFLLLLFLVADPVGHHLIPVDFVVAAPVHFVGGGAFPSGVIVVDKEAVAVRPAFAFAVDFVRGVVSA